MDSNEDTGSYGAEPPETTLPSCDSCRTRKLKCSRDKPLCSNCTRLKLSCNYDSERSKPGLKRGTVERLSRRIETLERKLLHSEQNATLQSTSADGASQFPLAQHDANLDDQSASTLSVLAQGMVKLSSEISRLSQTIALGPSPPNAHPRKRPRVQSEHHNTSSSEGLSPTPYESVNTVSEFLTGDNLKALIDAYFRYVHPWIPMIHMATFRRRMQAMPEDDPPLVLHAMLVGALRFVDPTGEFISPDRVEHAVEQSRNKVILAATNGLTVENLQALIILAFSHLGYGEPMKAWPLIASLSRTVDFLHLSIEDDDGEMLESFLRPNPLPPPADWMEEEERRRVFWNIFILDRICSITTGWSVGLTADNVWRRLPICGTHWNEEDPALSPFFGMWDKSAAKIGNSVAFLPAHYPSPGQSTEASNPEYDVNHPTTQKQRPSATAIDMSTIGAFAYYVESIESLCRVDMYFLRQKIDFNNRQEVSSWLTRFKELDLRLVHWKMFLPSKWKDPNQPPEATTALDPNMSLAHITHNTSMILLHQRIGYPEPELKAIKLPNFYSAETCQSAATETTNIARKYLTHAPVHMLLSPHFSFCIYISARVLIVHSRYYGVDLDPQFLMLIECLHEISKRWLGSQKHGSSLPLSAQFARSLENIHRCYQQDPDFTIHVVGPLNVDPAATQRRRANGYPPQRGLHNGREADQLPHAPENQMNLPIAPSVPLATPLVSSLSDNSGGNWASPPAMPPTTRQRSFKRPDDLSDILQTFSDERFLEMDRVICFDDFNFEVEAGQMGDPSGSGIGWNSGMNGWAGDGGS